MAFDGTGSRRRGHATPDRSTPVPPRTRSRRPADPGRRDRIARAVLEIAEEHGLIGVTHRTVANRADVPLGSTTYYFDSLDDLLGAALDHLDDDYQAYVRAVIESLSATNLAERARALTDLILASIDNRDRTRAEYALWLAAMDRPRLRPHAVYFIDMAIEKLSTIMPRPTASALAAAIDGLLIRGLVSPTSLDHAEVEAALTAILHQIPITEGTPQPAAT